MVNVAEKQIVRLDSDSDYPVVGDLNAEQKTLYSILNQDPDQTKIQQNKYSKYLPISHIEALMDSTFGPTNWKVSEPQIQIIGGNAEKQGQAYVTCTLTVSVINTQFDTPVWIDRGGAASDYVSHGKIKTFAAALKAEAFKNACKSLGKVFGRDLNRTHLEGITDQIRTENEEEIIKGITQLQELEVYFNSLSKADKRKFAKIYTEKKNFLLKKGGKSGK